LNIYTSLIVQLMWVESCITICPLANHKHHSQSNKNSHKTHTTHEKNTNAINFYLYKYLHNNC